MKKCLIGIIACFALSNVYAIATREQLATLLANHQLPADKQAALDAWMADRPEIVQILTDTDKAPSNTPMSCRPGETIPYKVTFEAGADYNPALHHIIDEKARTILTQAEWAPYAAKLQHADYIFEAYAVPYPSRKHNFSMHVEGVGYVKGAVRQWTTGYQVISRLFNRDDIAKVVAENNYDLIRVQNKWAYHLPGAPVFSLDHPERLNDNTYVVVAEPVEKYMSKDEALAYLKRMGQRCINSGFEFSGANKQSFLDTGRLPEHAFNQESRNTDEYKLLQQMLGVMAKTGTIWQFKPEDCVFIPQANGTMKAAFLDLEGPSVAGERADKQTMLNFPHYEGQDWKADQQALRDNGLLTDGEKRKRIMAACGQEEFFEYLKGRKG